MRPHNNNGLQGPTLRDRLGHEWIAAVVVSPILHLRAQPSFAHGLDGTREQRSDFYNTFVAVHADAAMPNEARDLRARLDCGLAGNPSHGVAEYLVTESCLRRARDAQPQRQQTCEPDSHAVPATQRFKMLPPAASCLPQYRQLSSRKCLRRRMGVERWRAGLRSLEHYAFWRIPVAKPLDPREHEQKSKKKPGGQQHQNPPRKTDTDNPERNPRDQKGRGGSK